MPGTWETISLNVQVNTAENKDSSYVFDVPEKDWVRVLGVQPTKTYFEAGNGSTFYKEFIGRDGQVQYTERGKWFVNGDSLRLISSETTYEYIVKVSGGRAEFRSLEDWDSDGQEDDDYLSVQRKISSFTK